MFANLSTKATAWWDMAWVGLTPTGKLMLLFGLFGQSLFVLRWFVQLAASEKAKKSVVPEVAAEYWPRTWPSGRQPMEDQPAGLVVGQSTRALERVEAEGSTDTEMKPSNAAS